MRPDVVIVHDAVRPLIDASLVSSVASCAREHGACGVSKPLVSTVIAVNSDGFLESSLDRLKYRASEMPQGFKYELITKAYESVSVNSVIVIVIANL